jgi:hypothetical protein
MGLSFLCPIHKSHRLCVAFKQPIDGLPPMIKTNQWDRVGETFDDLTLAPSIDASGQMFGNFGVCWHGHIQNGEVK